MTNRNTDIFHFLSLYLLVLPQAGCGDDIATGTEGTTLGSTSSGSSSSTEPVPTTSASTGDPTGEEPECIPNYPLPIEVFELADDAPTPEAIFPSRDCDLDGLVGTAENELDPALDIFQIYTYRPGIPMSIGDWPDFPLPYVIFSPGYGQLAANPVSNDSLYENVIEAYTKLGFIVFAIQPPLNSRGEGWSVGRRARAMACTAIWAFSNWSEAENDRLNCDFVVSGHSRGGGGCIFFC